MTTGHVLEQLRQPWVRRVATILGLALLLGAIVMIWRQRAIMEQALDSLAHPDPACVAILLAAVVGNVICTALMFSVLIAPHGRVPLLEMQAIIAAATLINYLPLRPGLFGRIAYHRAMHDIPAARTTGVIIAGLVITATLALALAGTALLSVGAGWPLAPTILSPVPVLVVLTLPRVTRRWAFAGMLRYVDLLLWVVRYDVAFRLIGTPIEIEASLALACVSIVAMFVPLLSNGLGVREWAVGLFAPYLGAASLEIGLSADIVNRAAEIIIIVALGLPAVAWLARRGQVRLREPGPAVDPG